MIKVVQIGCGKMAKYTMRYVYEKGATIVAALDINEDIVGKDIGSVIECEDKGVIIENIDNLDTVLKNTKPDIAIITTMSLIRDLHDVLRICVNNSVNVVTTCEEAFFVKNSNPTIWREIDVLAKANNCTVTGCGYQDFSWGNLIAAIAGTTHKIIKIKGSSSYNVEDYGIALAKAHGAGLSLDEFESQIAVNDEISEKMREEQINSGVYEPSYMWNTVGWLADKLGLTITTMKQKCVPQTFLEDLNSSTLNMTIKKGMATGMSAVVTAETKEGIILEAECIGKVYAPSEFDTNTWTVYGEPDTTVTINKPATVELTCADIVNRIPDVINAPSGFIPTSQMGEMTYRVKPLDEYLK